MFCKYEFLFFLFQEDVFSLSTCSYYAFIIVKDCFSNSSVRVKFEVDRSPLGFMFLRQCNDGLQYSYKGSKICKPFIKSESFYFANQNLFPPRYFEKIKFGKRNKYKQVLTKGAIGWYNNFKNNDFIVDQSLRVYINMDDRFPTFEAIPYIRHDRLQFCFGQIVYQLFLRKTVA